MKTLKTYVYIYIYFLIYVCVPILIAMQKRPFLVSGGNGVADNQSRHQGRGDSGGVKNVKVCWLELGWLSLISSTVAG